MKLEPRRIEAFLRDPGASRVVLLHGDDHGLIRERGTRLVKAVAGSVDDPFSVVELDRDSLSALPVEMMSQSMTGARRVIRVREAGDGITEHVKRALSGPGGGFAVLEAGSLTGRSKLRTLVEHAADAQAIACYPLEGSAAAALVSSMLSAASVSADDDAIRFCATRSPAIRCCCAAKRRNSPCSWARARAAELDTVMRIVGETSNLSAEDACFAATSGDAALTDRAVSTALGEGATAVGLLRAALLHLHRLGQARRSMDIGLSVQEAIKSLRPPPYFRRVPAFTAAMSASRNDGFEDMARSVNDAERACKRTGAPAEALVRQAFLALARRAAAARRG